MLANYQRKVTALSAMLLVLTGCASGGSDNSGAAEKNTVQPSSAGAVSVQSSSATKTTIQTTTTTATTQTTQTPTTPQITTSVTTQVPVTITTPQTPVLTVETSSPDNSASMLQNEVFVTQVFPEDIREDVSQSTPDAIQVPKGIDAVLEVSYQGAFRALATGDSYSDYAVGALAYNPDNHSIFLAGHPRHNAVAEFQIPAELSFSEDIPSIAPAFVLQDYTTILDKRETGNVTDKITGLLYFEGSLLVTSEVWYDAAGTNIDNMQVFGDAHDLKNSSYKGMLQLEHGAKSAGYMSQIPESARDRLDGEYLVGWASNYSIDSRYSHGPSVNIFKPEDAINADPIYDPFINIDTKMMFSLQHQMSEHSNELLSQISPVWGPLAEVMYGFVIPNTDWFLAIGSHGGLHHGTGYKIQQNNGNVCGGGCTYHVEDNYNYFWLFDINDMTDATQPHDVQPISYGKWSHPYDDAGQHQVVGATFDNTSNNLYIALAGAAKIGAYDEPPMIISYMINAR